jgi:hypothetical protein
MSDIPVNGIDLRAQLAAIDLDLANAAQARSDTAKLAAESRKLLAEQAKLMAEQMKLQRDWKLAPYVLVASLVAAMIGGLAVAIVTHIWPSMPQPIVIQMPERTP